MHVQLELLVRLRERGLIMRKKKQLVLHKETVRQLASAPLDQVQGGARGILEFSGGPMCTGGPACTFNWTCSCQCK